MDRVSPEDRTDEGDRAAQPHIVAGQPVWALASRLRLFRAARLCGGQLTAGVSMICSAATRNCRCSAVATRSPRDVAEGPFPDSCTAALVYKREAAIRYARGPDYGPKLP